jgi:hypothetical protein
MTRDSTTPRRLKDVPVAVRLSGPRRGRPDFAAPWMGSGLRPLLDANLGPILDVIAQMKSLGKCTR